jgi:FG-GAP-like repeat
MNKLIAPILVTLVLTACGGGPSGGSSSPPVTSNTSLHLVTVQQNVNTIYNTAVGDLNGDGREDVVVSGWLSNNTTSYLWVFTQNADGSLSDSTQALLGTHTQPGTQHVFIADFDSDGHNDIWLPAFRDGSGFVPQGQSVMFWGGAGQFTAQTFPDTVTAHGACIDDVNSDGKLDMVVGGGGIYYNQGSRNFVLDNTVLHGNNFFSACAVMHQSNGDVDILLGNNNGVAGFTDNLNVYNSAMVFQTAIGMAKNTPGVGDLIDAIAVDIDGDGVKDLITMYNSNSARDVWMNTGTDTYTYTNTLDTLGNDYYSYLVTVNNLPMILFPGNDVGTRLYQINNGLTVYKPTAFTDMKNGHVAQGAAVYRNTSTGKSYMLQLLDNSFYTQEIQ